MNISILAMTNQRYLFINNKFIIVDYNQQMDNQEKIQFFQSESSFGSESKLSDSRHYEFTNEIIAQTDNVFMTLKKELLPNQSKNQSEKIQYAIRRAQILKKNTIPQHINYLNSIQAPHNGTQQLKICSQKLTNLLRNYQNVKDGSLIYKQFYNMYGKEYGLQESVFSRKKQALRLDTQYDDLIKPQYIQINYSKQKQKLKGVTPRLLVSNSVRNNQKQVTNLRQEVHRLKKQLEDSKKNYQIQLANQKINYQKRLRSYLTQSTLNQMQKNLKQQLEQNSQNLTTSLAQNKKMHQVISQRNREIDALKSQNRTLKEEIERLRKTDNNQFQDLDFNNKSYNSQFNQEKKDEKKLKNLSQENELLKSQLKTQRQKRYKLHSDLNQEQRRQLQRNRFDLQKKNNELEQIYSKFDKAGIQILQLTQNNKTNQKIIDSLRRQNQDLKNKYQQKDEHYISPLSLSKNDKNLQISKNSVKVQISQYEGDGLEGFLYYQTLPKQFRIRFKRACLRQKDLLYKSNGIQIGVISNFEKPNKINILVHITNYSKFNFQKVKVKVMNANQNKIECESNQYQILAQNQQIKIPVTITLTHYPIGASILLLQYQSQKKQQIRILLPAHIFKAMLIQPREQNINTNNSIQKYISTQKKILKQLNDLNQYFKLNNIGKDIIKVILFNQHTHTLVYMDLFQSKEGLGIRFQHKQGNKFITEYFIKTFIFLLSKQSIK